MKAKLTTGQTVQGRYTVIRLLGEGGFGAVYLVQDVRLGGRNLALKESFDNSAEAQQQFQLEANLLASLSHPNLPRVSDYFIESTGCQYLVMDFVEGEDLTDTIINQRTPLPEAQALPWMIQVCQAVALLHSQRPRPIIHRDIKPPNIKITPAGQAVLVDFGIAKLYEAHKGTARIAKAFSPGFSPHEQYAGTTDTRSDVYALGATLYCMLTAAVPPDAFHERLIQKAPLPPPRRLNPQVSPAVEQIILRAMEMDPDRRYPSAQELAEALQACLGAGAVAPPRSAGIICPRCGTPNRPGAKFCTRDGAPLTAAAPARPPAGQAANLVCPRCGAINRPGARFCARDGASLAAPSPAPSPPATPVVSPPLAGPSISPQLSFEMGNAYARNDRFDEAIQAYRQALAGGFRDQALYHNLGLAFILAQRPREAIPVLREGLKRYDRDADLHYQMGQALAQTGNLDEAASELEQAVRLAPQEAVHHLMLGMVYREMDRHAQAIAAFEQAIRREKDKPLSFYLLGTTLLMAQQYARAEKALAEAVRLAPKEAEYHYSLGVAQLRAKRIDPALQSLNQAIKLQPDHYLAHYYLAGTHMARDDYQEALRWYKKAATLDPNDPDPHVQMGICYALLKRRADALASIRRALAIDPNHQRAREVLAKL